MLGFLVIYVAGIGIDAVDEWGFEYPQMLIPGIGPLLVPSGEEFENPTSLLLLSAALQSYFIWDYFKVNKELEGFYN